MRMRIVQSPISSDIVVAASTSNGTSALSLRHQHQHQHQHQHPHVQSSRIVVVEFRAAQRCPPGFSMVNLRESPSPLHSVPAGVAGEPRSVDDEFEGRVHRDQGEGADVGNNHERMSCPLEWMKGRMESEKTGWQRLSRSACHSVSLSSILHSPSHTLLSPSQLPSF